MPPPNKQRRVSNPDAKPGIIKQFLQENFSTLPAGGKFLNGHILYLYAISCEFSRTRTEQGLVSRFPGTSQQGSGIFPDLHVKMKKLVSQTLISIFLNHSNSTEFQRFESICHEKFIMQLLMRQSNPGSAIASENSIHPRSTLYVKQTDTSQMSMP